MPISEGAVLTTTRTARLATTRARIVSGREAVLEYKDRLVELSSRCGQAGAMDHLDYYLSRPVFNRKRPSLILTFERDGDGASSSSNRLESAVLIYEHQLWGVGCRWFSADFHGGSRTVIAPGGQRSNVAFAAAASLLKQGALLVQVSYEGDTPPSDDDPRVRPEVEGHQPKWAATVREMVGYLPMDDTVDATLARLGKNTRRNLLRYRRRAETGLQHTVIDFPRLTREEFIAFNRICRYPVTDEQAAWRHKVIERMPAGTVFLGLKSANGQWLSLAGGRTYAGNTDIEWQMNRADMPSHSLGILMRSHLIEREVQRGTRRLYFVGGTTNSIRTALVASKIIDMVVLRYGLPRWLARRIGRPEEDHASFVGQMLSSGALEWRPW